MKTGDWLKLSVFALVGVVISLAILGVNSSNNARRARQQQAVNGNYFMEMQGYSNASFAPQEFSQPRGQQVAMRGERPFGTPMQGTMQPMISGATGDYNQQNYLPSQLLAMNYQLINNDVYMQREITEIQKHGARLHNEVTGLQAEYGLLRQGLNGVYATLANQVNGNTPQNASTPYNPGMSSGNGMLPVNAGMTNVGMGMSPMQNQAGMGGMGMDMNMMNNMMGMMNNMMGMMGGMQNSGNGSGNSGGGMSSAGGAGASGSSGGGMGMM